MNLFVRVFCATLLCFSSTPFVTAQANEWRGNFLIDANRPMTYLSFDHMGLGAPNEDGKRQVRIWFNFVNNCRLGIAIHVNGSSMEDPDDEMKVQYEIVLIRSSSIVIADGQDAKGESTEEIRKQMPVGTSFDVGSLEVIAPGKSARFSVPVTNISRKWEMQIPFHFDLPPGKGPRDDNAWGGYVTTHLSYSESDLPAAVQRQIEAAPKGKQ